MRLVLRGSVCGYKEKEKQQLQKWLKNNNSQKPGRLYKESEAVSSQLLASSLE